MPECDLLFGRAGTCAHIVLNRPGVLNAVTHDMVRRLDERLRCWATDDQVACVTIEGAGSRAFAAGGDIRALYDTGRAGAGHRNFPFYADEYRLNALIKRYPKPFVAFIDGINMGGGVGLSVHGSHRALSAQALFAMPETGIGLFPDVGGSYFLPRMPGETGMYLGLTGARLGPADCLYCGVGTHFVAAECWPEICAKLEALAVDSDRAVLDQQVADILTGAASDPGAPPLAGMRGQIDRNFSASTLAGILDSLAGDDSEWAARQRTVLGQKSPTSLHIAFRQLRLGRTLPFEDCMRMEYRLVRACMVGTEFYEGVRAVIIDKDQTPRWNPPAIGLVREEALDAAFAPIGADELAL